tara:strand:- start:605 stop:1903 length:1299 start_codon:yes stop_codon:yes gene_type:complete
MKNNNLVIVGLGSIGANLAHYLIGQNYKIRVWDKNLAKLKKFSKKNNIKVNGKFSQNLIKNDIVILTINAGKNVDNFFYKNIKSLKKTKYLIDLGNNHPEDTLRRYHFLKKQKIKYINPGFSGGVEGAKGKASLMLSCDKKELEHLSNLFSEISGNKKSSLKLIGKKPHAGNYVKIVHNSIEYSILQSLADYYFVLKNLKKITSQKILREISYIEKRLKNFYLLDIFKRIILRKINLNKIMDKVDDNNTGAWASQLCMKYKFPTQILHSSVDARYLSKSKKFIKPFNNKIIKLDIRNLTDALIFIIKFSYIQGLGLLNKINKEEKLGLNLNNIILSWKFNSIIRSGLLINSSMFFKENKFELKFVHKKFFSNKKIGLFLKTCKDLTQNNLYPSTFLSVGVWLFHHQKYHFSSFSLIQKMRNIFGNHKIKIKY